jgi:glyoxylase-like metal-dependent hydrolase (beta-lactamase superfamily II)
VLDRAKLLVVVCARLASILLGVISIRLPAQVGTPLAPWTPGLLDIHQISTGRGNAALFILPDGTTLLVDAGAAADGAADTSPHPDGSRTPGAWIARYVARHIPVGVAALDYALITHFHGDHMGQVTPASRLDRTGNYRLTGITEVAGAIPYTRFWIEAGRITRIRLHSPMKR